jgi:5-methyltetrahydropteroyltriglutamate--homocysteine methyltransferase
VLAASPVEAIGLDFVAGPGNRQALAAIGGIGIKTLVAGVVDGRNTVRTDLPRALSLCQSLLSLAGNLVVSTSCSLLHAPLDLHAETSPIPAPTDLLACARQKVHEVAVLGCALTEDLDVLAAQLATAASR